MANRLLTRSSALSRCFTSNAKENCKEQVQVTLNESCIATDNAISSPRVTTSSLLLPVRAISDNQASICSHKVIKMCVSMCVEEMCPSPRDVE